MRAWLPGPLSIPPLRALVAAQLFVIAVAGIATVARFPVWALVDERAHYANVEVLVDEHRLPILGRDLISSEAAAIDEGVYPSPPRVHPRNRGLAVMAYEAFQPPLYYALATPAFAVPSDHLVRVRALRALNLALLAVAIALTWLLARAAAGASALAVFSVALTVYMWPGVLVRAATISNAGLELVFGVAVVLALWCAHSRRDVRWLVMAGGLAGLGLLTRLTLISVLPLLGVVAALLAARIGSRRAVTAAAVTVALPLLLLAPWLAYNLDQYGSITASELVREMQEPVLNPSGRDYGVANLPEMHEPLLNGVLPEEWWFEFLSPAKRRIRDVFAFGFFAVPLGLALAVPARTRWPIFALLVVPLVLAVISMQVQLLAANWNSFYPRYLIPWLPLFGVFAGIVWRRALVSDRAMLWLSGGLTLTLTALWVHLATLPPFVP